jgi:thioredoxin reductase
LPVELNTFVSYGRAFQKRFVPNLEDKLVVAVKQSPEGFVVQLEDGEKTYARRVVVAVGISYFGYVPPIFSQLPKELVSHSSAHSDVERFKGCSVAIVGAGGSALDLAASLHEAGASVELIARGSTVRFQDPPGGKRSFAQSLLKPRTGIGSGKQLYFFTQAPHLFRLLPEALRLDRVRRTLGPAPPWFTRQQVEGKMPFHLGVRIASIEAHNGHAVLQLTDAEGRQKRVEVDHVIAATGYKPDIDKLELLSPAIRKKLRLTAKAPALSAHFESSVPNLYFVGVSSANTFGPLMRFAFGADYTARRISKYLAKASRSGAKVYTGTENAGAPERA